MHILYENISSEQADAFSLVLASSSIPCRIQRKTDDLCDLLVPEIHSDAALHQIDLYVEENRRLLDIPTEASPQYRRTFSALWVAAIMTLIHWKIFTEHDPELFLKTFGSSSSRILNGDIYLCVTSLFLHTSWQHLAGNAVFLSVFGTFVCQMTGYGCGWLMILLSGFLGNLTNAVLYQSGHLSVGASTSVFGAIGILASMQFLRKVSIFGKKIKTLAPAGAGLALLAMLGASEQSDITAHLFGFVAGALLGGLFRLLTGQLSEKYQIAALSAASLTVIISWSFAAAVKG